MEKLNKNKKKISYPKDYKKIISSSSKKYKDKKVKNKKNKYKKRNWKNYLETTDIGDANINYNIKAFKNNYKNISLKMENVLNEVFLNINKTINSKINLNSKILNEENAIIKDTTLNILDNIDKDNTQNILDTKNINNWDKLLIDKYIINTDNILNLSEVSIENNDIDNENITIFF